MEKICTYVKALWIPPLKINIPWFEEKKIQQATSHQGHLDFTKSSLNNDSVGIGVHWQNLNLSNISISKFLPQYITIYLGKLVEINVIITYLQSIAHHAGQLLLILIFTDFCSDLYTFNFLDNKVPRFSSKGLFT